MGHFFKTSKKGIYLFVHLTPRSIKDELLDSMSLQNKTYLKARVCAAPEKGKANLALCKLISKSLGLPKTEIEVISGHTSRLKTVHVRGSQHDIEKKLRILKK